LYRESAARGKGEWGRGEEAVGGGPDPAPPSGIRAELAETGQRSPMGAGEFADERTRRKISRRQASTGRAHLTVSDRRPRHAAPEAGGHSNRVHRRSPGPHPARERSGAGGFQSFVGVDRGEIDIEELYTNSRSMSVNQLWWQKNLSTDSLRYESPGIEVPSLLLIASDPRIFWTIFAAFAAICALTRRKVPNSSVNKDFINIGAFLGCNCHSARWA